MNNSLMQKISVIVLKVRTFVEQTQVPQLTVEMFTSSNEEMSAEWKKMVNAVSALKNELRDVDYVLYLLTEAQRGISVNTAEGTAKNRQINAHVESLKILRRCLCDIDDGYYRIMNYFEKAGYKI